MDGLLERLKLEYAHDAIVLAGIENGSVRGIPLTKGKITIVDTENYEWLMQWRWCTDQRKDTSYARRNFRKNGKQHTMKIHREILNLTNVDIRDIDHKNGNGLDNRRINLRLVSPGLNGANCRMRKNNTSGFRGVYWHKKAKKWGAQIMVCHKQIYLGLYSQIEIAGEAYKKAILHYWGNSAIQHPRGGVK